MAKVDETALRAIVFTRVVLSLETKINDSAVTRGIKIMRVNILLYRTTTNNKMITIPAIRFNA